jgi:hypothetical protein
MKKASFISDPVCRPHGNTDYIELAQDWCFLWDGVEYWIPTGYWYDGASIPRPFWPVIGSPFHPDYWIAVAHDWLYLTHLTTRKDADEILYQLLRQKKVGTIKAHIIWGAVRSGAAWAWKNNVKDTIELKAIIQLLRDRPDRDKFHFSQISVK